MSKEASEWRMEGTNVLLNEGINEGFNQSCMVSCLHPKQRGGLIHAQFLREVCPNEKQILLPIHYIIM